jgi:CRISPR type III-B/RAMP module RAMP protein Cmr1
MQSITFECEVITPMFLAGADGSTPELRPPSIKGALRFWWRALNGHLPLRELKRIEGEIFGDTEKRSKVIIHRASKEMKVVNKYKLIAHKGNTTKSFDVGETFKITFKLTGDIGNENSTSFDFEKLKALFEISCYLGGLGKRNRRGNGCVKIKSTKVNNQSELAYEQLSLKELTKKLNLITLDSDRVAEELEVFKTSNSKITSNFSNINRLIPHIISLEEFITDNSLEDKRLLISKATHETILKEGKDKSIKIEKGTIPMYKRGDLDYSKYIGSGSPRFASPIIMTISPKGNILIIKLKTIKTNNDSTYIVTDNKLDIQNKLIETLKEL